MIEILIYDKNSNSYYEVIPVKKIEEKIEELKLVGRIKNITFADYGEYHYHKEIDILQQLIEENCEVEE